MARAEARHILVESEERCLELKKEIENGAKFETVAQANSQCPSGRDGGNLGEFGPGQMVAEFDKAVFSSDVGVVVGPVQTQFGWHLIEVTKRV
ncbi:MAG: peptidylprolyl isomerase [Campylobacterota bacterium]